MVSASQPISTVTDLPMLLAIPVPAELGTWRFRWGMAGKVVRHWGSFATSPWALFNKFSRLTGKLGTRLF
jgi:hypothetical protein